MIKSMMSFNIHMDIHSVKMPYFSYEHFHSYSFSRQFEPVHEKTNNLESDQVRHKPACTVTEDGQRLEILD